MPRKSRRSPAELPQQPETWHVAIPRLRAWITEPGKEPQRPFAVLTFNLDQDKIQQVEVMPAYPTAERLLAILLQAMQEPPKGIGQKPHRPSRLQLEDAGLVAALQPELEQIGIEVSQQSRFEEIDEIIRSMEDSVRGGLEPPGLLSMPGVTPALVGSLFAAAADFYRTAPWIQLMDRHTLAIRVAPEEQPRFVQVMGGGGVEYGLAMYRRWEDVERMFSLIDGPLELLPPEGGHSFFFDRITQLPFEDIEAIEKYGWEVAGEEAYPMAVIFTRSGEAKRPGRADLIWYEAALRAIPLFVRHHLRVGEPGDFLPVEVSLTVPTHAGRTEVYLKYPAGVLAKETRPVDMTYWPQEETEEEEEGEIFPPFDRRAMEGMMRSFSAGFADPDLQQAQELMYQAWEETNPGRRIILAHEALSISMDCADAYVLLAEEEADTLGRALDYYQQGVAAGERALGQGYFEKNAGYFWGLLETRPYMRARQGLANTLWELNRKEEAAGHYREMLRLNPGDNQGIRYTLLNLLVSLNREEEAQALIKQYEDDATAEWLYTHALLAFRQSGSSQAANEILQEALVANPHLPDYLAGRKRVPVNQPDYITWGGEDEAINYASSYLPYWRQTPGAIDWLQSYLQPSPVRRQKTRRKRGKKRS